MTSFTGTFFLSATLVGVLAVGISGCEKSAEATDSSKAMTTTNPAITDMDIATNVKSALTQDSAVGVFDITVVVSSGDVRLTGFVDNEAQREQALNVARSVKGVHDVKSELTIKE